MKHACCILIHHFLKFGSIKGEVSVLRHALTTLFAKFHHKKGVLECGSVSSMVLFARFARHPYLECGSVSSMVLFARFAHACMFNVRSINVQLWSRDFSLINHLKYLNDKCLRNVCMFSFITDLNLQIKVNLKF